jgi:hypothetical protein
MIIHTAVVVLVAIAPIVDASPVPFGASVAISRGIGGSVIVDGIIIDVARTDMRRIITAAVVIGKIIAGIARTYPQINPWAAATIFDLNHIIPGV